MTKEKDKKKKAVKKAVEETVEETVQEPAEEVTADVGGGPGEDGDEKDALITELTAERDKYLDLAQRARAEFDNYRRRSEQERLESVNNGVRDAITALLPVIDNLDRAVESAQNDTNFDSLKEGVEMVHKQLFEILANLGTEEIEAQDKPFDPNYHHAVMQGEADDEHESETVLEVFQKGYSVKGKIIRHAMVKVAK